MRILIIRPLTRTAFELAGYCSRAFENLGHEVGIVEYRDIPLANFWLSRRIGKFRPDFILVVKGDRIPPQAIREIRKRFKVKVANYWIDDPLWINFSQKLSPAYDYFFTNDPQCLEVHKKAGCLHPSFLSFGHDPELHRTVSLREDEKKEYGADICFCGTMVPLRMKYLKALSDFNLKIWWPPIIQHTDAKLRITREGVPESSPLYAKFTGRDAWGEKLVKAFNASKIVLNIHSQGGGGTNMRTFEATGCGSFLLSEYRTSISQFFKEGEEVVCFKTPEEMRKLAKYYLEHPEQRKEIARKGQARARRDHTYVQRMREILWKLPQGE